jgi:hypothetical protein
MTGSSEPGDPVMSIPVKVIEHVPCVMLPPMFEKLPRSRRRRSGLVESQRGGA